MAPEAIQPNYQLWLNSSKKGQGAGPGQQTAFSEKGIGVRSYEVAEALEKKPNVRRRWKPS